jgi:hypothetical protein
MLNLFVAIGFLILAVGILLLSLSLNGLMDAFAGFIAGIVLICVGGLVWIAGLVLVCMIRVKGRRF